MLATHVNNGVRAGLVLIFGQGDGRDLIRRLELAFGAALLAYCIMTTHLHVIATLAAAEAATRLDRVLFAFGQRLRRRHVIPGELLRGPPVAIPLHDRAALARAIDYVHLNPVKTSPPLVRLPFEYPLSSAREFCGLALAPAANLDEAARLSGHARTDPPFPLADLEKLRAPVELPDAILAAAAQAYGRGAAELAGHDRDPALAKPRAAFLRLGRLEGYSQALLGSVIGRSAPQACRLAAVDVHPRDLQVIRTLLRRPALREHVPLDWRTAECA